MNSYVAWLPNSQPNFCNLGALNGVENPLDLRKGVRMTDWPSGANLHMDPNYPKNVELPDNVRNQPDAIVVSTRLKEFLESKDLINTEYLPVQIVNHKGKLAADDYFLLNFYKQQDCIDKDNSDLMWNPIDSTLIAACKNLVIDEAAVEAGAFLFPLAHFVQTKLIRRDIADAIVQQGFSGVRFIELDKVR